MTVAKATTIIAPISLLQTSMLSLLLWFIVAGTMMIMTLLPSAAAFGLTPSPPAVVLPPIPPLKSIPLPVKLAGGLFLFQTSVQRKDKEFCNEILDLAQAQLRMDPLISMELGTSLEAGGVFCSTSSSSTSQNNNNNNISIRQLIMEFQINGGNSWAQARVHGVKIGPENAPARLVSLEVANMDASLMGGFAKVTLPPWNDYSQNDFVGSNDNDNDNNNNRGTLS